MPAAATQHPTHLSHLSHGHTPAADTNKTLTCPVVQSGQFSPRALHLAFFFLLGWFLAIARVPRPVLNSPSAAPLPVPSGVLLFEVEVDLGWSLRRVTLATGAAPQPSPLTRRFLGPRAGILPTHFHQHHLLSDVHTKSFGFYYCFFRCLVPLVITQGDHARTRSLYPVSLSFGLEQPPRIHPLAASHITTNPQIPAYFIPPADTGCTSRPPTWPLDSPLIPCAEPPGRGHTMDTTVLETQHHMEILPDLHKKRGRDDEQDLSLGPSSFSEHRNVRCPL